MQAKQKATPPCTVSLFLEKGVLSPDEFILAGDNLVSSHFYFDWAAGYPERRKSYFPADKQYLVCRQVPCLRRFVSGKEDKGADIVLDDDEGPIRSYVIEITYDEHYKTPRVWLTAYNMSGTPMEAELVCQDISQDNPHISMTIEVQPHEPHSRCATVHPCINAAGMKRIIADLTSQGVEPEIDKYLLIFLKFMASVIPYLEYTEMDYLDSTIRKRC